MSKTLLVIPHYRDSARVAPFLADLLRVLNSHFSILISDDGSGPEETERLQRIIVKSRESSPPGGPELLDPILNAQNTGKGGAVLRGWNRGEDYSLLAFADADGAVSAKEILRAEQYFRSGSDQADALFGSRVKMLGRSINRMPIRHISGRVFATLVSIVARLQAYDTQCGLKILTQDAFQKIKGHMKCAGFAFDVELCLLLLKARYIVKEFPVDWADIAGSKVSLLRDSTRMALEVLRIRSRVSAIQY